MTRRSATVGDLRRRNRAAVLRALLRAGEGTRASLARDCSLSTATLTNVVADLLAEGLVEEAGQFPSQGGRPIARLVPCGDGAYFLGADIGEHGITVELFDLRLRRVDRDETRLRRTSFAPEIVRETLTTSVAALCGRNPQAASRLVGIGLGLPGVVERSASGDVTVDTQSLGWEPLSIDRLLPSADVPVFAENGAKTMATAEAWLGAARESRHSIAALIGRGIGAGFVLDGSLLRGASGSAGEWGHTKVALRGRRCRCGGDGCLEAYVGGTAIVERWAEAGGHASGSEEGDLARLIDLADQGDQVAAGVLDETVEILGLGLANLVNLFNPETVVIGGWVGLALADCRLARLETEMRARCLVHSATGLRLEASHLGSDAVALGAALLPLQRLVEDDLQVPAITASA